MEVKIRDVLLSTGEFTKEAVITCDDGTQISETAPKGCTTGMKEKKESKHHNKNVANNVMLKLTENISLSEFDEIVDIYGTNFSSALSMAYVRFLAHSHGYSQDNLYKFIDENKSILGISKNNRAKIPIPILNILNGGKHAGNGLEMCEFMIVPKGKNINENMKIASKVYQKLRTIIIDKYGKSHTMVGREGGFAPRIDNVDTAISLIETAIEDTYPDICEIAIDVAANNFSYYNREKGFTYKIDNKKFRNIRNTRKYCNIQFLNKYYTKLLNRHPKLRYLEDPLHENDKTGWYFFRNRFDETLYDKKVKTIADDLTVSNVKLLEKNQDYYTMAILKINQIGTVTGLIEAYNTLRKNNKIPIISQRSGETESNFISHLAVGLGSDYIKAGAPARERIAKYNELIRISDKMR